MPEHTGTHLDTPTGTHPLPPPPTGVSQSPPIGVGSGTHTPGGEKGRRNDETETDTLHPGHTWPFDPDRLTIARPAWDEMIHQLLEHGLVERNELLDAMRRAAPDLDPKTSIGLVGSAARYGIVHRRIATTGRRQWSHAELTHLGLLWIDTRSLR